MCGRTHGQPGLPITFGFKAAVWAAELDRHLERLRQGRGRWEVVQLGGALGTMEFWGERALDLLDRFAARLGLGVPDCCRGSPPGTGWPSSSGCSPRSPRRPGKIGNEVYQLQRPEIGELRESFTPGTVGSITMPHKRNPEISEHLVTLSRVIRAQASVALDGMVAEHERDGRAWKAEWLVVPETSMAFAACAGSAARMLDGLPSTPERMLGQHRQPPRLPAVRAGDAGAGRPDRQALRARQRVRRRHARHRRRTRTSAPRCAGTRGWTRSPTRNSTSCWRCGPR